MSYMINHARNPGLHPDIQVIKQITADMLTLDGIFGDTDIMDLPSDGWLIVNVVGDNIAHELYVPQLNHKEQVANYPPVLNSGIIPDTLKMVNYKVWCPKGSKPKIAIDLNTGTAACALGAFYRGRGNPVAMNTPDIVVSKAVNATTQNMLSNTDMEDVPYAGHVYCWGMSATATEEIAVTQRNYRAGNYSDVPSDGGGLSVDISKYAPLRQYVPKGGQPQITVQNAATSACYVVAAFYLDYTKLSPEEKFALGYPLR